jgi:hypothetical protein
LTNLDFGPLNPRFEIALDSGHGRNLHDAPPRDQGP